MNVALLVRRIVGIPIIAAGIFMSSINIGNINGVQHMGGPMVIDLMLFIEIFFLATGLIILFSGALLAKFRIWFSLLLISIFSFSIAAVNLSLYPTTEGAYYILRYGTDFSDKYYAPEEYKHILAFSLSCVFLCAGLYCIYKRKKDRDKNRFAAGK